MAKQKQSADADSQNDEHPTGAPNTQEPVAATSAADLAAAVTAGLKSLREDEKAEKKAGSRVDKPTLFQVLIEGVPVDVLAEDEQNYYVRTTHNLKRRVRKVAAVVRVDEQSG